MKNIREIILAVLIFFAFSSFVFAGDYAHFHFIGFSNGGEFLAFEEYGIKDEADDSSPYSVIYIVNVDENNLAAAPVKSELNIYAVSDYDKLEAEVSRKNRQRANKQLKRFGIVDGNRGLQVAAHLINEYDTDYEEATEPTKESAPTPTPDDKGNTSLTEKEEKIDPMSKYLSFLPQQVSFTKRGNALYRDGFYQIKIKPVPVTQKNCDEYERDMFSFEMTLTNEAHETKTLQKSGKVPKNRGCADGYGIQEAFLYQNKLAVFVGIFTRGWEGENMRLMSVTGELDN